MIASQPKWRIATVDPRGACATWRRGVPAVPPPVHASYTSSHLLTISCTILPAARPAGCPLLPLTPSLPPPPSYLLCLPCHREGQALIPGELDPKVVEVYQGVGKVLSRYTAGKVR